MYLLKAKFPTAEEQ